MAKGQKRSNRETRKLKQPKAKTLPPGRSLLESSRNAGPKPSPGRKG
jgi:hypothetical protein